MKKLIFLLSCLGFLALVTAFSNKPTPIDNEINIRLTISEADVVLSALNEAPIAASKTQPVAKKILSQAQEQLQRDTTTRRNK